MTARNWIAPIFVGGLLAFNAFADDTATAKAADPQPNEFANEQLAPPATLVVRVKVDEEGNEQSAEVFQLNRRFVVIDEQTARAANQEAEKLQPLALDDSTSTADVSQGDDCYGRWGFGGGFGGGFGRRGGVGLGGFYGQGFRGYYGYGGYNRALYPSYGYYNQGYGYPYMNYGYRYNASPYRYYYYNRPLRYGRPW